MLLHNKVAVVTGAAEGIGRAIVELFAREGARVVVADVNAQQGEAVAEAVRTAGGEAMFYRVDVGRMDEVRALIEATIKQFGRLDVVCSNAAAYSMGNATEITEAEWDRTLAVCLKATWMLAHYAVPIMQSQGGGNIVVTGSLQSIRGSTRNVAYQAAKGGVVALVRSLAADYAPAIRVNAVLPGGVSTNMSPRASDKAEEESLSRIPLERYATPDEIAKAALFLASDMSSYVTGASLVVDGGMSAIIPEPGGQTRPRRRHHMS
ncbi:MAG TPA: SDR family NAD(P)-dependent oxidoreductase [Bauldia sp.]|nr:SDR family NAD(P)-dependent oxidoreductase [Bauldia sp.]